MEHQGDGSYATDSSKQPMKIGSGPEGNMSPKVLNVRAMTNLNVREII